VLAVLSLKVTLLKVAPETAAAPPLAPELFINLTFSKVATGTKLLLLM